MISAFLRSIAIPHLSKKSLWQICVALTVAFALTTDAEGQSSQAWAGRGSNVWSTTAANWQDGAVWTNGNNATFGSTPRALEIAGTVTANSLSLDGGGWVIQDGNNDGVLTLVGEGRITTERGNTTINENIAGGNLVKSGATMLVLGGANTYTGATTVETGMLQINHGAALALTSGVRVDTGASMGLNNVTVAGVSITINGGGMGDSSGALKACGNGKSVWAGNVTIGSAGSRVGANLAGGVLEITGVIDSGGGVHGLNIRAHNDGGTVVLSNAGNTYLGNTTVVAGILKVGVANALPAGTVVHLGNAQGQGTATFDLNGFDQRVGGVTAVAGNNVVTTVTNNSTTTTAVLTVDTATAVTNAVFMDGNLSLVKEGSGAFVLTHHNLYTGATTVNAGTLEVSGLEGAIETTEYFLDGGTFSINNGRAATNKNARINDSSTFTFRGGSFAFTGSADTGVNSTEAIGSVVLDRGFQTIGVSFGGTNASTLVVSGITRNAGGGVAFLTGANLGADPSSRSSASRIFAMSTPRLVGSSVALDTGINAATKDTWIVSYLLGSAAESSGGAGTHSATPNTFVTYNAQTGFRPLNPIDEFRQDAIVPGNNTRITRDMSVAAGVAINSLIMAAPAGSALSINNGQVLTVTSGAILFASSGNTISGGTLNFEHREAIIYANGTSNSTISSVITGSGGLTVAGNGVYVAVSGASTYTGDTTLLSGTTVFSAGSTGAPGVVTKGPFGRRNLVFAGGAIRTSQAAGTRTLGNDILFKADTTLASGGSHSAFTGSVTLLEGDRVLTNSSSSNTTFSGVIGDDRQNRGITIDGDGSGAVIFSDTNTYTGATHVHGSTLLVNGTHATGSSYRVNSPGTLGGGGSISVAGGGSVTIAAGGTLSVGNGTGNAATLSVTTAGGGALLFADHTSILRLDLVGDASARSGSDQRADGTRADRLVVIGKANLNGARLFIGTLGTLGSTTFSAGDRWRVFEWVSGAPSGTFTINPETDLPVLQAKLRWDLSDLYAGGTIGVVAAP